jgi:hypothetical protein
MTFGEWYRTHPLAWVGTGLAIVGLGMGIGGGASASNSSSSSNADVAAIQAQIPLWNTGKASGQTSVPMGPDRAPPNVCNPAVLAASTKLNNYFGPACATTQGDINNYHTGIAVMATGWVFFGIGAVGTIVYTFADWYPKRNGVGAATQAPLPRAAVVPLVSPGVQGLGVVGTF